MKKLLLLLFIPFLMGGSNLRTSYTDWCADSDTAICTRFNKFPYAIDESPVGRVVELSGATYTASGKEDGAYSFDGTNDYIRFLYDGSLSVVKASMSFWLKELGNTDDWDDYVAFWNDTNHHISLMRHSSGDAFLVSDHGGEINVYSAGDAYVDDLAWHHIVMTWDTNDNMYFYFDGDLVGSTAYTVIGSGGTWYLWLGYRPEGARYSHAVIDEFMFINDELTAAEVKEIYTYGLR